MGVRLDQPPPIPAPAGARGRVGGGGGGGGGGLGAWACKTCNPGHLYPPPAPSQREGGQDGCFAVPVLGVLTPRLGVWASKSFFPPPPGSLSSLAPTLVVCLTALQTAEAEKSRPPRLARPPAPRSARATGGHARSRKGCHPPQRNRARRTAHGKRNGRSHFMAPHTPRASCGAARSSCARRARRMQDTSQGP